MNEIPDSNDPEWVIAKLKDLKMLNDSLQDVVKHGSAAWHIHESVDDILHDLLQYHGD